MTALLNPPALNPAPTPPAPAPITPAPTVQQAAAGGVRPFLWTVKLFHQLGDMGFFAGRRAMIIRGVLLEQGMMNPPHAEAGEKTEEILRTLFGVGWRVRVQKPLVLGLDTDPEPDIAVMRGHRARGFIRPRPSWWWKSPTPRSTPTCPPRPSCTPPPASRNTGCWT